MRHWLPQLAKFPAKYIYEPWKAPIADQRAAGCLIGTDYPKPIVAHETIVKTNMDRMNKAYAKDKEAKAEAKAAGKGAAAAAAGSSKATTGGKRKLQQTTLDVGGS